VTFPPGLPTIVVTGTDITDLSGQPLNGVIIFSVAAPVADPAVSALLEGSATGEVTGGVMAPIRLVATDCVSPPFTYTITQHLVTADGADSAPPPAGGVSIPSTLGPTVDVSALLG
jgi:hypothetical protein